MPKRKKQYILAQYREKVFSGDFICFRHSHLNYKVEKITKQIISISYDNIVSHLVNNSGQKKWIMDNFKKT